MAYAPTRVRESATFSSSSIRSTRYRSRLWLPYWRISTGEPNPKKIVRDGYDRVSYKYRDDAGHGPEKDLAGQLNGRPDYEAWLAELIPLLRDGDPVLDLGCGCGVPVAAILAERYQVTGVDLSPVQIARASQLVPRAQFECTDMATVDFPSQTFAAVVSFYAIIHVPAEEQLPIFRKIGRWLRPGGYFLGTVGSQAWTGSEDDWHGAPMYWSHADLATYVVWLEQIGFGIVWTRFIPEGTGGHTLILASAPISGEGEREREV